MISKKTPAPNNFLHYSDAIEVTQPDEATLIDNIVAGFVALVESGRRKLRRQRAD